MNVQKRPTNLADPLPNPKIKLWHQDGLKKTWDELNFQDLDEFYTMKDNTWKM